MAVRNGVAVQGRVSTDGMEVKIQIKKRYRLCGLYRFLNADWN